MHRDLYQKDIEEEFQIRKSTVTGYVQLMEKNGYLTRESDKEDARKKCLVPTARAEKLREAILEDIKQNEKLLEKGISAEDVTTCKHVLYQVLQNLIEKHKEEGKKDE
jgi:DNA-binding MarR family transcriptional regulator